MKWSEMKPRERDSLILRNVLKPDSLDGDYGEEFARGWLDTFHPSTNIADAWMVVDKLKSKNIVNLHYAIWQWTVDIYDFDSGKILAISSSETAPEAICKAALKAAEIDIED